jgi:hypothetical protein
MKRDGSRDGSLDVSVLVGCDEPFGCTTCGGLNAFGSQLWLFERRGPGSIEALLITAARVVSTTEVTAGRVLHGFRQLNVDAQKRVLASWKQAALAAPHDCTQIVDWISRLRDDEADKDLDDVIVPALPFLLATCTGLAVLDRLHAADPTNTTLATVQRAQVALKRVEKHAYPQQDASADRLRAGINALPFLQRLAVMRSIGLEFADMLDDAITAEELESMMLPEIQQAIDFLLEYRGTRSAIAVNQLKKRRRELQQTVRQDVSDAIGRLDPVSQLAMLLSLTRIPLAVAPTVLVARHVVDSLPQGLHQELARRAAAATMHRWRRYRKKSATVR